MPLIPTLKPFRLKLYSSVDTTLNLRSINLPPIGSKGYVRNIRLYAHWVLLINESGLYSKAVNLAFRVLTIFSSMLTSI